MKRKVQILSIATASILVFTGHAGEATHTTTHVTIPVASVLQVPCALAGQGEQVALTGATEAVFVVTDDGNGGHHVTTIINETGITGTGLTSGAKYQSTGVNRFSLSASGQLSEITFVNNVQLVGPGSGNNLLMHETIHLTINANGEVTANIASLSADCR